MELIAVKAVKRGVEPKGAVGRSRKAGQIPAVLYGGGMDKPLGLYVSGRELAAMLDDPKGPVRQCKLEFDGQSQWAFIKDYQIHPVKRTLVHLDFQACVAGQPVRGRVPMKYTGTAVGEKAGGRLYVAAFDVMLEAAPENLPRVVEVDITPINANEVLYVDQVNYGEGVKPVSKCRFPLVIIKTPKGAGAGEEDGAAAPAAGAAAAAAPAKPE
jgi:large subunit ribosomal protein L25